MSSLILLRRVRVENANAIAGLTYGFPAITHFLGFSHALSRRLTETHGLRIDGCAVSATSTRSTRTRLAAIISLP
jgi:CRISPR-associated protein Csy2